MTENPSPLTPRPTHDAEHERALRHSRMLFGAVGCMLVAWILYTLSLPLKLTAGIPAIVAIVLLLRALITAWPTSSRSSTLLTAILGIPACGAIIVLTGITALFYGPVSGYEECISTAITDKATGMCADELPGLISDWFGF